MLARYQNGCLQTITRKDGVERWQFRWLHKGADGISRERKKTIGPVKDYPENSKKLQDLLAGLRLNINTDGPTELTSITMTLTSKIFFVCKDFSWRLCGDRG